MNKVILMGRLTADPDKRMTTSGTAVAFYRLAVDRLFNREGEQNADFLNCVTFGKAAEFAEKYLRKGTKIVVEGRLQTRIYETKEGEKRVAVEVVAENHFFCESKSAGSAETATVDFVPVATEDMPF